MKNRSRIYPGDGDPRHGTTNGYTNLGCPCAECCAANTVAHREYMRSHPEQRERHRRAQAERDARRRSGQMRGDA